MLEPATCSPCIAPRFTYSNLSLGCSLALHLLLAWTVDSLDEAQEAPGLRCVIPRHLPCSVTAGNVLHRTSEDMIAFAPNQAMSVAQHVSTAKLRCDGTWQA